MSNRKACNTYLIFVGSLVSCILSSDSCTFPCKLFTLHLYWTPSCYSDLRLNQYGAFRGSFPEFRENSPRKIVPIKWLNFAPLGRWCQNWLVMLSYDTEAKMTPTNREMILVFDLSWSCIHYLPSIHIPEHGQAVHLDQLGTPVRGNQGAGRIPF